MERQLRAGGGLMTLDEPRQGFFLGKIVKKAKRAVKKITKSPIGKAALAVLQQLQIWWTNVVAGKAFLTSSFAFLDKVT